MATPARAARAAAAAPARTGTAQRRRPRLVPDSTGVRIKEHAAQDRVLLQLVERLLAA